MWDRIDRPLEPSRLGDFVKDCVPDCGFDLGIDLSKTFILINTNGGYDPRLGLNHWVPAVSMEALGEEYFLVLKNLAICESDHSVSSLEMRMSETVAEHLSEKDTHKKDLLLQTMDTIDFELTRARSWKSFLDRCWQANIYPKEVPGDGN